MLPNHPPPTLTDRLRFAQYVDRSLVQPEFAQRDAEHVGVCAPCRFGLPVTYPAIASRRSRAEYQS